MPYRPPLSDIRFCLDHVVGAPRLAETELFSEATPDTVDAILTEVAKLSVETLAPLQIPGDAGCRLVDGRVVTPEGYKAGYAAIAEGGWLGLNAEEAHGGMGLPLTLQTAMNEMFSSACLSLSLCPLLSQGSIEALSAHASPELQERYLSKLISGEWTGTMNLTEGQAGSDVGALKTKATPAGDGSYRVEGQKIYISWGDHDLTENIVHLVLARLPDAPAGSRGISLFLVPKFLPDGTENAVKTVSIEHKMGLHGSPTCVLAYEGSTGWLVGEENKGLACMFTMMNNARLGVGVEGLGAAEAAMQHALAYALDRVQGKASGPQGHAGIGSIMDHPDVRRMLMEMKAYTEATRALCYDCALSLDMAKAAPEGERAMWAARGAFLTPLAKSFGTDAGMHVAELGVQVHGGMGFIEETGAAQFYRDVRVTAIYEGTNGIHAADLVGRKLSMDGGATARAVLDAAGEEVAAAQAAGLDGIATGLAMAHEAAARATVWMLEQNDMSERLAGSTPYLTLMSHLHGGALLSRGARAAQAGEGTPFDTARIAVAEFHAGQIAPMAEGLAHAAMAGSAPLYALTPEQFAL